MCCQIEPHWIEDVSKSVIAPFAVAAITYFLFGKIDELRKRRSQSKLGASILHTIANEVEKGRDIIRNTPNIENGHPAQLLPTASWQGINTINDEVLLRILEVTKGVKDVGFPAFEIRIHTKNYFEYVSENFKRIVTDPTFNRREMSLSYYDEAATGVLNMLKHIQTLLEKNSDELWPK